MERSWIYIAHENYETPKDRALRIYLERQKAIQEKREQMGNILIKLNELQEK